MAVRQDEFFMQEKNSSVLLFEKLALSTRVYMCSWEKNGALQSSPLIYLFV